MAKCLYNISLRREEVMMIIIILATLILIIVMVGMPNGMFLETLKSAATYRFLNVWDFQAIFSPCHT